MDPITCKIVGAACLAHQVGPESRDDLAKSSTDCPELRSESTVARMKSAKSLDRSKLPRSLGVVTVGGHVRRPGLVKITEGMSLAVALEKAGGVTEFAAVKRARLVRNGRSLPCDLGDTTSASEPVLAGDVLEIPQKTWIGK
ncbi:SLBB domain-containing protein [Luteolibacter sp. GHJ8]|uniref:SLBB domain-containing protein n=1 Tax=Luteolibacter rhizosphaerae TaxID=2989719 RepID=A0ABT3G860_9BACT|nr:SLBB domain-containing protein [Luteolibacter rhizosphaerae]MCW1916046.1 SLBB domain-containing protein [Luteolibacter rhizosphaerae]